MSISAASFFSMRVLLMIIGIFISIFSAAQLCNGSLGDPVVNITFGSGAAGETTFAAPGYTYTNSFCPSDGSYTITNFTSGCFRDNWHTVSADHSGNGAFMLVNASFQPADFFLTTVTGLCRNTTYEFSMWIMNVLKSAGGIQPNITFSIETTSGSILNTYNTGDIGITPQPEWKQYGLFFTTAANNPDVVLRIRNNAPGGGGNDLALDDISFRPCGPVISSAIRGNNNKVDVCINEQITYDLTAVVSPGFISPEYQWQASIDSGGTWKDISGAADLVYQRKPTTAGNFWYRLAVAENGNAGIATCRIASNVLIIHVHPKPVINAGPDRILINGGHITMSATIIAGNNIFSWSPPDFLSSISILNPIASPDKDMVYSLTAVSEYGCTNEDQVLVKVVAGIFVPTAFTPNNDGKNDSWTIPYLDPLLEATVNVYNRYGQLVYHASASKVDWNGSWNGIPQPSGTYVYLLQFKDGSPAMKGTINLIR
ncbi:MAG TPA: gliding motility-associated C-terminal domain-containing protein [Chitinophagaceae bacterium]|nr:gliding motility-associated C-terminal domain-containing protein [Chitinophagaceae bacterium]